MVLPSSVVLIDSNVFSGDLNLVCVVAPEAVYALVLASCSPSCPPFSGCQPSSLPLEYPTPTPSYGPPIAPYSFVPTTFPPSVRQSFFPTIRPSDEPSTKGTISSSFLPSNKPVVHQSFSPTTAWPSGEPSTKVTISGTFVPSIKSTVHQSFPPSTARPSEDSSTKVTISSSSVPSIKPVVPAKMSVSPSSSSSDFRQPVMKPHHGKKRGHGGRGIIVDSTAYTLSLKKQTAKRSSYFKTFKNVREYES